MPPLYDKYSKDEDICVETKKEKGMEQKKKYVDESTGDRRKITREIKRKKKEGEKEKEKGKIKRRILRFGTILRYKRYLTKKGNIFFDFNCHNLELNEKEMLVQNSTFYHLFDLKSLLSPHIPLNIYSHMNINLNDYLNYLKKRPQKNEEAEREETEIYFSKQEHIMKSIDKEQHIECFRQVKMVKKLFLLLNKNYEKNIVDYFDEIPEINLNDYIFVQTNLKNDILLGYVKSSKYNLYFEIFNFKELFQRFYNENIEIDVYCISGKMEKEEFFETKMEFSFLKEHTISKKRERLQQILFYDMYYFDYYFSKNSITERRLLNTLSGNGEKQENIFVFNICIKCIKDRLLFYVLFNMFGNDKSVDPVKANVEKHDNIPFHELDLYNTKFNLNDLENNKFKSNSFFTTNLYYPLKVELISCFIFSNIRANDYIKYIYFSKLKLKRYRQKTEETKQEQSKKTTTYTFTLYCLTNEGWVYILFCNIVFNPVGEKNNLELFINKYLCFKLHENNCCYVKISRIKYNSQYLNFLCSYNNHFFANYFEKKNVDFGKRELDIMRLDNNMINICNDDNINKIDKIDKNDKNDNANKIDKIANTNKIDKIDNIGKTVKEQYHFLLITCKNNFCIICLKKRKRIGQHDFNMELLNYSVANEWKNDTIIHNVHIIKENRDKYNKNNMQNKCFTLFEILCFYDNGFTKKYKYKCTMKKRNSFEFYLVQDEKTENRIYSQMSCLNPLLFPFNEENFKQIVFSKDMVLNSVQFSYFKNIIYIYFQEKQYENVSFSIKEHMIIVNFMKSISNLFKKASRIIQKLRRTYQEQEEKEEEGKVGEKKIRQKKKNVQDLNHSLTSSTNSFPFHWHLFTQQENKIHFMEFKFILFGFYDLHLINRNSYGKSKNNNIKGVLNSENEEINKTENNEKNILNSCTDIHSHYNFLQIIKNSLNFEYIVTSKKVEPSANGKGKINLYYFLLILENLKKNNLEENDSFFHLIYSELRKHIDVRWEKEEYKYSLFSYYFENYELINIKKYVAIILSFLFYMYNVCLHKYGVCNGHLNSKITFFLINKKAKKNKRNFKHVYNNDKNGTFRIRINDNSYSANETNNQKKTEEEKKKTKEVEMDGMIQTIRSSENNVMDTDMIKGDREREREEEVEAEIEEEDGGFHTGKECRNREDFFQLLKCFYFLNQIAKYMNFLLSETYNDNFNSINKWIDVYKHIYICQILYISLNVLRINNTNIYVNLEYSLKKNNWDFFYVLILLNFYASFFLLTRGKGYEWEDIIKKEKEKNKKNKETDVEEDMLLLFFKRLYSEKKNENSLSDHAPYNSINAEDFECYISTVYEHIQEVINKIHIDMDIIQKFYFLVRCPLCNTSCVSNLYNNYYVCVQNHIFYKCMLTFCCIYKNSLLLPRVIVLKDCNTDVYIHTSEMSFFNFQFSVNFISYCSFCYFFFSKENMLYRKNTYFDQCPFCNHELCLL